MREKLVPLVERGELGFEHDGELLAQAQPAGVGAGVVRAGRLQLWDSLRKRRMELLEELAQLETRKLELCQTKEVVNTDVVLAVVLILQKLHLIGN